MVGGRIGGVLLASGESWAASTVVITTGTFLNGLCHVGDERFAGGRVGDAPAVSLSAALRRVGLTVGRFKTGTTPRLARDSVDYVGLEAQGGEVPRPTFSCSRASPTPSASCSSRRWRAARRSPPSR